MEKSKNISMGIKYIKAITKLAEKNDRNISSMIRSLIKKEAVKEGIWEEKEGKN